MSNHDEPHGFLNRWSARKQAVEQEQKIGTTIPLSRLDPRTVPQTEEVVSHTPAAADTGSAAADNDTATATATNTDTDTRSDEVTEPLLGDADMPAIETLTARSDISGFFSKGVSAALRKAALRHVFRQSSYNVRDGLNDYDGDFTSFEPLGDTITSDMKFHAARKEKARLKAEKEAVEEEARLEAEKEALEEEARLEADEETLEEDRLVAEEENLEEDDRLQVESEILGNQDRLESGQPAVAESGIEEPAAQSAIVGPITQTDANVDNGQPEKATARSSNRPERRQPEAETGRRSHCQEKQQPREAEE